MTEFLDFWYNKGIAGFIGVFWFYFVIELPRYIFFDYSILLITYLKKKTGWQSYKNARRKLWEERPFLSIIIPGKDEGKHYQSLVRSLNEQTYQNFEIIIVDDGSDDESQYIGRAMERNGEIALFLRNKDRGGKASAANLALNHCNGKYVVHLDADCSFYRNAIEQAMIPFYIRENVGAVGGNLQVRNDEDSLCTMLQAIEYLLYISVGRTVSSSLGILRIVSGAFGVFRKDVLERIKGWDVGPGLDGDLTIKIRKLGYKIHFEPKAVALTSVPNTFGQLTKQRIRWSRSLVRFRLRKHLDLFKPNRNFSLSNFASVAESVIYDLLLNLMWYGYIAYIIINFHQSIGFIMIAGLGLYTLSKVIEFLVVLMLSENWENKLKYIVYLPAMVFYTGYYIRFVRTWAYFKEFFFRSSYKDSWNPPKTSSEALRVEKSYNKWTDF